MMDAIRAIGAANGGEQLTPEEMAVVAKLAARDREVRAHEAQHMAAAGGMANGAEYTYELGPDGKMYAIGGKVRITMTSGSTPEDTLAKARQLRAAANAPADPSGQDMTVAAQAGAMEARALQQIARENSRKAQAETGSPPQYFFRGLDRTA